MKKQLIALTFSIFSMASGSAFASTSTSTSLSGLDVTTVGASTVGGIVVDLVGTNGAHVVSQLSASSLFVGFSAANPFVIGSQAGFLSSVYGGLGGGLASASIRFSLYDGDTASGNFDFNDNDLLVNGINFGNWSTVNAENTTTTGASTALGFSGGGFRNNVLDTGWFGSTDTTLLASLYASIVSNESLTFEMDDVDPGDNFFDFTQGIDGSLINVGQGPGVIPPSGVPEASSIALLGLGLFGLGFTRRSRKSA